MPAQRAAVLILAAAMALGAIVPLAAPAPVRAAPTDLFISEYIEGTGFNKAIEIFNGTGTPIDLAAGGYTVELYSNGSATLSQTVGLEGTVAAGDVFVLTRADADPALVAVSDQLSPAVVNWNGDDAVALRKGGALVDVIGQIGFDPGTEWGAGLTSTADNTIRRKATIEAGDPNSGDAFDPAVEWVGFANNTFDGFGAHATTGDNQPVVATCGAPLALLEGAGGSRQVTATDADGTVTAIAITGITPSDPGGITIGATTPASMVGGTALATVTVDPSTPNGSYSVTVTATNDDATPQTGMCTLTVSVQEVLRVSDVQGQTLDSEDGQADRSPLAPAMGNGTGQPVFVRGVVTQRIRQQTSTGATNYSFFLQDSLAEADGDPLTSDGIVVFIGGFTTVLNIVVGGPTYFPEVGDQVILRGNPQEFFFLTELSSPRFVAEEIDKGDLASLVQTSVAAPPDDLAAANRYWERLEGMRLSLAAGAKVVSGRDVFASTADGEVWAINGDHALAQRAEPYARRVYRDPHPLDDIGPAGSFDNGNGMRMLLISHGLKWLANSNATLIAPARTFDTVNNALTGGLFFAFEKYGIEVEQQPDLAPGVDPSLNSPPSPHDDTAEYATAPYNVENLYDFRDDPFDGCDFTGNAGCPGVQPPFDFVPSSTEDYQAHLGALAGQIVNDLHAPDLLLIQEAEDQDICAVVVGALDCDDGVDNRDGKPDTLQELGLAIAALGGPSYDAAYDRNGADDRGIVAAFLYRTDRVQLLPADATHPVFGNAPTVDYRGAPLAYNADVANPKALNADLPSDVDTSTGSDGSNVFTRPPQIGYFRVWRDGIGTSVFTDLYAASNHFSSTPDARVGQRTEQAAYLAAIAAALADADDGARVVVGGDFNVFPRPDDPFTPRERCGTTCIGPSDQLAALYELGLHSLWEVVAAGAPLGAYSYVFDGQAQTLDNQFVTDLLSDELNGVRYAHVNADWPAAFDGDGSRGASDHDPQVARYDTLPTIDRLRDLIDYLVGADLIDPSKVAKLEDRLDKAEAFYTAGKTAAGDSQLVALGDQAQSLAPRWIDAEAADAIQTEALLLVAVR